MPDDVKHPVGGTDNTNVYGKPLKMHDKTLQTFTEEMPGYSHGDSFAAIKRRLEDKIKSQG